MKQKSSKANRSRFLGIVCMTAVLVFGLSSCRPDYDLDTTMPANLGSSIYEFLQDEGYDTYVRLIEDLNYKDVLAKTGSKTLFVADEEAVQRFYQSGTFKKADGTPVSCYEDLSIAQKKMILFGSMLNNVYQVAMLSSSEGPTLGDCMRRVASNTAYDSVPFITPDEMPTTKHWQYYKNSTDGIVALRDLTIRPIVFFVNKFLTMKKITDDDYDFLFNQGIYSRNGNNKPGRQPGDATVNGVRIKKQNLRCFNGFVHEMEDVIYSLPNMAEYLDNSQNTKIYSALVERFCAPYYSQEATDRVNALFGLSLDSVFQKRYFSQRSQGNAVLRRTPNGANLATGEILKFDPGWNGYYSNTASTTSADVALQQNMAVMLVPSDEAMKVWWNEGGGKPLKDRYGAPEFADQVLDNPEDIIKDMAGVPNNVIVKLLNNNQLNSFVGSVPSKFANVLDDANDPMGLTTDHVDSVAMCCNGAVYFTNKVFSPTAYRSVSFPALVTENLQIIYQAIEDYEFDAYLNSMVATYSFFIPTVTASEDPTLNGRLIYIDPIAFGNMLTDTLGNEIGEAIVFFYNQTTKAIEGREYQYHIATDSVSGPGMTVTPEIVQDRLSDLLDYHIVIGDVEDPRNFDYFQTKGRGTIKVGRDATNAVTEIYGGYQIETGKPSKVIMRYDMTTANGNGKTYIIDRPLQSSRKSVYNILSDSINYPEFSEFHKLVQTANLYAATMNEHAIGSIRNISTFNTYHYTVYVPTNESIKKLINDGILMTADDIEEEKIRLEDMEDAIYNAENSGATDSEIAALEKAYLDELIRLARIERGAADGEPNIASDSLYSISMRTAFLGEQIEAFVKYHIQDNSVYYGAEFKIDTVHVGHEASYETAYMNKKNQFEKLRVRSNSNGIFLRDTQSKSEDDYIEVNVGAKSESGAPLYNIMCREYEYNALDWSQVTQIETSSFVVIHQIKEPLCNGVIKF
jgi:hypothetical protein